MRGLQRLHGDTKNLTKKNLDFYVGPDCEAVNYGVHSFEPVSFMSDPLLTLDDADALRQHLPALLRQMLEHVRAWLCVVSSLGPDLSGAETSDVPAHRGIGICDAYPCVL